MICQRCKKQIQVEWMKLTGVQSLESAMRKNGRDHCELVYDAEEWPEFTCGCPTDKNPLISERDSARLDMSEMAEWTSVFDVKRKKGDDDEYAILPS